MNIISIFLCFLFGLVSYIFAISLIFILFYKFPHSLVFLKKLILKLSDLNYISSSNVVFQNSFLSCGAACIEMILIKYNIRFDREDLKTLYEMHGTSMLDLRNKCLEYNLNCDGFQFNNVDEFYKEIKKDNVNSIISFDYGYIISPSNLVFNPFFYLVKVLMGSGYKLIRHWVIIDKVDKMGNIYILDPFIGQISMRVSQFEKLWNGRALIIKG